MTISAIDMFCGAGGLAHGLLKGGIQVNAGVDIDPLCRTPFEQNNKASFLEEDLNHITASAVHDLFGKSDVRCLVGCAPCQTFSSYTQRWGDLSQDSRWNLLDVFGEIVSRVKPEVVSMENVPMLERQDVFKDFLITLANNGYYVSYKIVYCPDYGIPQSRKRLILLASLVGEISVPKPTHSPKKYRTVRDAIATLPAIEAGEVCEYDNMHYCASLSPLNMRRIRASKPGGTWRDWPTSLRADCHKKKTGKTYPGVYGRMEWDKPSPTITTQGFGYGNGRFGHPEQDRGLSLREMAILQSFPKRYKFCKNPQEVGITSLGRLIGNAVPVTLGKVVARGIKQHLGE